MARRKSARLASKATPVKSITEEPMETETSAEKIAEPMKSTTSDTQEAETGPTIGCGLGIDEEDDSVNDVADGETVVTPGQEVDYDSDEIVYSDDEVGSVEGPQDEEAPEAVTATQAREKALQVSEMQRKTERRRKAEEKQKRRERDARLALQQKDKKMRIAERVRRLPDEVLQAAQELEEIEEEEETQGLKKGKHTRMADDDENPRKRSKKKGTAGEYEVGGFRVVARNIAPKPPAADPAVLEFRNRQLFGGRVKRADAVNTMASARKRKGAPIFFVRA